MINKTTKNLSLNINDNISIEEGNAILLKNVQKVFKTFEERLAEYGGPNLVEEFDWGHPVGKEIW